ncbi:hypothetical protein [Sandaracinus amylolyticus]|uniref:hypothetical protein n=1 Tax=Sandaracinus amylolyticus TaxID=927083 RepID=UPI001F1CAF76|nr:hypothetical protein [Sandaracinus amylolyticus]
MSERGELRRAVAKDALAVALSLVTCPFAFVLTPPRTALLLGSALALAGGSREARRGAFGPGALAIAMTIPLIIASFAGHGIAGDGAAGHALGLLMPVVLGAVMAPFALAPLALLDRAEGALAAMVRAFELAVRRGAARMLRDGAALGGLVGIAVSIVVAVESVQSLIAAWACVAIVMPIGAIVLARAYVDASQRAALDGAPDTRVTQGLQRIVVLVVPAALALGFALLAAALTPAPMVHREIGSETLWRGAPWVRGTTTLPGDHGIEVTFERDTVVVRTADGGGAGRIEVPRDRRLDIELTRVARTTFRGVECWALRVDDYVAVIDDEGVRLDDSTLDRIATRAGAQSLVMVLVALAALAWWSRRMSRAMAQARALDAPRWGGSEVDPTQVVLFAGRLRLDEGAYVEGGRTSANVTGAGRVVSLDGSVVIALPTDVPLLVPSESRPVDGAEVAIALPSAALARLGPRAGACAWPEGARLVLGDRDEAAEQVLASAARSASLSALVAAVMLGGVALSIAMRL